MTEKKEKAKRTNKRVKQHQKRIVILETCGIVNTNCLQPERKLL